MAEGATSGRSGLMGWLAGGGAGVVVVVGALYFSGVLSPDPIADAPITKPPVQTALIAPDNDPTPTEAITEPEQVPLPVSGTTIGSEETPTGDKTANPELSAQSEVTEPTSEPVTDLAAAEPEPALLAPSFDVVRVDIEGNTVIAGTGTVGSRVTIFLDGQMQTNTVVDRSGAFVSLLSVPPSDNARILTMTAELDGQNRPADDQIILAPTPRAEPEPEPEPQFALAESEQPDPTSESATTQTATDTTQDTAQDTAEQPLPEETVLAQVNDETADPIGEPPVTEATRAPKVVAAETEQVKVIPNATAPVQVASDRPTPDPATPAEVESVTGAETDPVTPADTQPTSPATDTTSPASTDNLSAAQVEPELDSEADQLVSATADVVSEPTADTEPVQAQTKPAEVVVVAQADVDQTNRSTASPEPVELAQVAQVQPTEPEPVEQAQVAQVQPTLPEPVEQAKGAQVQPVETEPTPEIAGPETAQESEPVQTDPVRTVTVETELAQADIEQTFDAAEDDTPDPVAPQPAVQTPVVTEIPETETPPVETETTETSLPDPGETATVATDGADKTASTADTKQPLSPVILPVDVEQESPTQSQTEAFSQPIATEPEPAPDVAAPAEQKAEPTDVVIAEPAPVESVVTQAAPVETAKPENIVVALAEPLPVPPVEPSTGKSVTEIPPVTVTSPEPTPEPTADLPAEPVAEKAREPVAEPPKEPVAEPVAEPLPEPAAKTPEVESTGNSIDASGSEQTVSEQTVETKPEPPARSEPVAESSESAEPKPVPMQDVAVASAPEPDTMPLQPLVTQPLAEPPAQPPTPTPVTVLRAGPNGIEVLQSASPVPQVMDKIALDTISYSEAGEIQLSGRAQIQTVIRVYLDNKAVGDLVTDETGRWSGEVEGITPGIYTLRLDELGAGGNVLSRIETPFKRESPEVLRPPGNPNAVAQNDTANGGPTPLIRAVTVQRGDTLWAISRERYGDGVLYVRVFEANRRDIRDPDLIYPGQVFKLPE